jgi:hypothetical protein
MRPRYVLRLTEHSQLLPVACPGIFSGVGFTPENFFGGGGGGLRQKFFSGDSTNSAEDRGQREQGSGGGKPLVRGPTQFANE